MKKHDIQKLLKEAGAKEGDLIEISKEKKHIKAF